MLDISLLGPTEVRVSGVSVSLSPLERNLLAVLALSKGVVISTDRIIDSLWADRLPAAPRSRVQGLVSSLRRKVGDGLVTRHPGYLIESNGITLDLDECEDLAREARHATQPSAVATYLRRALGLWRGEPLDGVSAPGIEFDRVRLNELRLSLLEERFAADLELGRHADLVGELTAVASAHPLRERLAGQLMLALYRCNRQADALSVYRALRERLADELGSDPCPDLRALHAMILRGEAPAAGSMNPAEAPGPDTAELIEVKPAPAPGTTPSQLPAGVGHFTGRDSELAALTRAISRRSDEPRVLMISGGCGIGKTALMVQWAHSVADRYPDGQIFVDLHGRCPLTSPSATNLLGVALAALGVSRTDIPETTDERAALYRTLISGRRVLICADDAGSVDQLLTLVPPTTTSQLVATSRNRLVALAAHHAVESFPVQHLSPQATHDLLSRIAGPERLNEPAAHTAVHTLVQWCGGWPMATRLAGTKLAVRSSQGLDSFVSELDELAAQIIDSDPSRLRHALVSAHANLSPAAAHLFGRLGLSCSSSVILYHPSAASDPSVRRVRQLLDELVSAHLIVEVDPDRYRIHDVVRRFARRCGAELIDRDAVDEWVRRGAIPQLDHHMAETQSI